MYKTMTLLPDPGRQPHFYDGVPFKRLVAWIIDSVVIFAISALVVLMTAFVGLLIWPLLYLVIGFVYRVVTLTNGSSTLGMRFAGIELRNDRGERLDAAQALLHTTGFTVSFAIPVLQVISVGMMLIDAHGRGLTDTFMGTVALNRRAVS